MRMLLIITGLLLMPAGLVYAEELPVPFAVVELFASEGCSSCPPADHVLRKITADARANAKHVYTLSFEVDYWDYLGWKDPFSDPLFTQRQQRYAEALASSQVYTPQMVINGREAFVGSDERRARSVIAKYLNTPSANGISLDVDQAGADLKVDYSYARQDPRAVVNVALVERGLESRVTAGENAGSTLLHDNIVRAFKTVELDHAAGSVILPKPQSADLSHFSVIAYVQSKEDMHVLAASGRDLK